jgi:uncharacterized protein with ParB-like and HNH nuclease domain
VEARAASVLDLFEKKMVLQVPLFQRQYVWNQTEQWEPLWEDIERKFIEHIHGRKDPPVHFLGAMVLDQKQTWAADIDRRQVIDGQQRLTTLQIFLVAFQNYCNANDVLDLGAECQQYTRNSGMLENPLVDRFKVWPTNLDREQFADVMTAKSERELLAKHPLIKKKYTSYYYSRPPMVEAYFFFAERLHNFFRDLDGDSSVTEPLRDRLLKCFRALRNSLKVVSIDLQADDDPQVIFETLNARGAPLLPADLLRNFIFLRAAQDSANIEDLYDTYWKGFEDAFWHKEERQGRLRRPRSDIFMQHFLSSRQATDVPVKHLFVEYKHWIQRSRPFTSVKEELETLATQRDDFRLVLEPRSGHKLYNVASLLAAFDISTIHPLLLCLLARDISDAEWATISTTIESYVVRRAVCDLTSKNYNKLFLALVRELDGKAESSTVISAFLTRQFAETSIWPDNETFRSAWRTQHAYRALSNPKIVHIFRRLNETYHSKKTESVMVSDLTVEHILPQNWVQHWPLRDGSVGMTIHDLYNVNGDPDASALGSRERYAALQTIGNLTILTHSLNAAVSNGPWTEKRSAILMSSILPINQSLQTVDRWDELAIASRSDELFQRAATLWPRP